ncbi:TWiK family of potassium channels protein 18, partial [Lamellibrachia satsuma]
RERRRRMRQRLVGYCKATAAFLFSHIGLAGLVVAYSIVGGFLFQTLEAPFERTEKKRLMKWKNKTIDDIWQLAVRLHDDGDNFTLAMRDLLNTFQTGVITAMKDVGWDGKDLSDDVDLRWSYAGALLYAVTVITTIGYGHLAPKTPWGRFLTIIYALVGIPLTFLYLSNVGNFLADSFRLFYKHICCDICWCRRCERKKKRERLRMRKQM